MTPTQFAALSRLMRLLDSPTAAGLRMVLVDGLTHLAASEASGAQRANITRAIGAARRCIEDANTLAGAQIQQPRIQGGGDSRSAS